MSKLTQLVYASIANPDNPPGTEEAILSEALAFNKAKGLTGFLHKENGIYVQVLEGTATDIDEVMALIIDDNRHHNLCILTEQNVPARHFSEWQMAFNDNRDLTFQLAFGVTLTHPKDVEASEALELFQACAEVRRGD